MTRHIPGEGLRPFDKSFAAFDASGSRGADTLPINRYAQEIKETFLKNDSMIVVGETGSGKTTQIPLMLRDIIGPQDKIAITQPRRVAATSIARHVAQLTGTPLGQEVGYQVRFDDQREYKTRLNFMTDGILLQKFHNDPLLREYTVVMVDEAHERTLNIDFTLGLVKRAQKMRKEQGLPPLKVVVTSATIEQEKFSKYFDEAPVVNVPGRQYKVDIHYKPIPPASIEDGVRNEKDEDKRKIRVINGQVKQSLKGDEGDILVFLKGQADIEEAIKQMESTVKDEDVVFLPLHGQLSPEDQDKIFAKDGKRKVIYATNIAETSVTIDGVKVVIDSGEIRQTAYNSSSGIEALHDIRHAQSGCNQRAGRAGRTSPGVCYRMYSEEDFTSRDQFQTPEILRSNLSHVILAMKKADIDPATFDFIDRPEGYAIEETIASLQKLGAFDERGELTETGRIMADLPIDPHISRMVIESQKYDCVEKITTIAAFLGGKPLFNRPKDFEGKADEAHKQFKDPTSDFLTFLKVWDEAHKNGFNPQWAHDNFINIRTLREAQEIRGQLLDILYKQHGIAPTTNGDAEAVGKSITAGFLDNLMVNEGRFSYRKVGDRYGRGEYYIHPGSMMFNSDKFGPQVELFVTGKIQTTGKTYARINQAVKLEWLKEIAPHLIKEDAGEMRYDSEADRVVQSVYTNIGGRSVGYETRVVTTPEAARLFFREAFQGADLLSNRAVATELYNLWLKTDGKAGFAALEARDLVREKMLEKVAGITSRRELQRAMEEGLDYDVSILDFVDKAEYEAVQKENPDVIEFGGKQFNVSYEKDFSSNGVIAVIAMDAQSMLTMTDLPTVPSGRRVEVKLADSQSFSRATTVEQARRFAHHDLVQGQLNAWKAANPIDVSGIRNLSEANLPEKVEVGTDPLTGEPLFAYPAVRAVENWGEGTRKYNISVDYFRTPEEAEEARINAEDKLSQLRIDEEDRARRATTIANAIAATRASVFSPQPSYGSWRVTPESPASAKITKNIDDWTSLVVMDTEVLLKEIESLQASQPSSHKLLLAKALANSRIFTPKKNIGLTPKEWETLNREIERMRLRAPELNRVHDVTSLTTAVETAHNNIAVRSALQHRLVSEYIGTDQTGLDNFRDTLLQMLAEKKIKREDVTTDRVVEMVIEAMT